MSSSDERGRYLDFEQIHWKIQIYFAQLERLMKILDKKQGDINQTEKLFNEFKVCKEIEEKEDFLIYFFQKRIHDEKLIALIESLIPELTRKAQNYSQLKKKGKTVYLNITNKFSFSI
jgi:hypothetical protein